jgi:hypothetical protein
MNRFVSFVKTIHRRTQQGEYFKMKKLMIAALGLAFALGTISFAAPKQDDKKTTTEKKKKKKKTTDKM